METREQRGLAIAALYRIEQHDGKWLVPSQSGDGTKYEVDPDPEHPTCTCPDHRDRGLKCKHMFAVEFAQTREVNHADGTETITRTFKVTERVTYKQDWPAYNKAQTSEKRLFQNLLADLCNGVKEPQREPSQKGRPPVPLCDLTFAVIFKVYSTVSTRRFACDLKDAADRGYIGQAPHFNSIIRGLDSPALTPVLKNLIAESSRPLRSVETAFAVDSTGFSTSRFVRWFDIKYGRTVQEREWVKVHACVGTKTNVITAVEILDKNAGDAPQLPALLNDTRRNFNVKELSADAAYLSVENVEAVHGAGATPFIAFKDNSTGAAGGLFAQMYHYYQYRKDEFLKHYHLRSNVETTFSMVKAKFGSFVRSKTDTAMINEVLAKILAHNICCLIQSAFELGVQASFWEGETAEEVPAPAVETDDALEALAWV